MRIGDLASQVEVNPKTIRYYEEIGLLPPAARSESGYRLYSGADVERLRFILKAKAIGLTLEEISEILALRSGGEQPCEHVVALLDDKIAAVDEQLGALGAFREELVDLRSESATTMDSDSCVCGIIEHHETISPGQTLRLSRPR